MRILLEFKHFFKTLLILLPIGLTAIGIDQVNAQVRIPNQKAILKEDALLMEQVTLAAQQATVDDFLVEVARTQNFNVLMDTANVATTEALQPAIDKSLLRTVLTDFAERYQLGALRDGQRTILFWKRPGLKQLALQLLEREQAGVEEVRIKRTQILNGSAEKRVPHLQFNEAMQRLQQDPELAKALSTRLHIGDLPESIRMPFVARIQSALLGSLRPRLSLERAWFTDDFSQQARVQIDPKRVDEFPQPHLIVGFPVQKRGGTGITLTLARLDAPLNTYFNFDGNEVPQIVLSPDDPLKEDPAIPPATLQDVVQGTEATPSVLDKEAALQVVVSCTAKRQPLSEFLSSLKDTGVELVASSQVLFNQPQITAHCKVLRLAELMKSVSRLYGAKWFKTGAASYQLRMQITDGVERRLLSLGDPYLIQDRTQTPTTPIDWGRVLLPSLDRRELGTPQGAPVSDLPDDVRKGLQNFLQGASARRLIKDFYRSSTSYLENCECRMTQYRPQAGMERLGILARYSIMVVAPDGRILTQIPWQVQKAQED